MISLLKRWATWGSRSNGPSRTRPASYRPSFEPLEGRWQPAKFLWDPGFWVGDQTSWHQGRNWDKLNTTNGQYETQNPFTAVAPGAGDEALFNATAASDCRVETDVTVWKLTIDLGYKADLVVNSTADLNITTPTGSSFGKLYFNEPAATIRGPSSSELSGVGHGTVRVKTGGQMDWHAGSFKDVRVLLDHGTFSMVGSDTLKRMTTTDIIVAGNLTWFTGHVDVIEFTGDSSQVHVTETGRFKTLAAGRQWGIGVAGDFAFYNDGFTEVEADGVVTIAGDYINEGTTHVKKGTLKIKTGKAESTGFVTLFNGASVDTTFAADTTLYILRGRLDGDGTVMGKLSLSRQNATDHTVGGEVHPGLSDVNGTWLGGTINVTQNFYMWTTACSVYFYVGPTGLAGKLAVAGTAYIRGGVTTAWDPNYKPDALNTVVVFMTWGSRSGHFERYYTQSPVWSSAAGEPRHVDFDYYSDVRGIVATSEW